MLVKEVIKRLSRYPENTEVGVIHCDSSFSDGDVETNFSICSRKSIAKYNVGNGFEDVFNDCDVLIRI